MIEILKEFIQFLKERKKWWLIAIALVLVVAAVFIIFSESTIAPLIYTLF